MINYTPASQINNRLFDTPFDQALNPQNRWVVLRSILPWDELAQILSKKMSKQTGRSSVDLRFVIGALVVQSLENLSDEDTIAQIQENVYMQYFVGLPSFSTKALFVPELFVTIRKRLGEAGSRQMSQLIVQCAKEEELIEHAATPNPDGENSESTNRETLKIDATVAPQYIKYPTDCNLLDESRKITEQIIDHFWKQGFYDKKPRTHRRTLDKTALTFKKSKKPRKKQIRQVKTKLINSLTRNLKAIDRAIASRASSGTPALSSLKSDLRRKLLVVSEIYRQQLAMYKEKSNTIDDRIVSIHQPWVRPIVRGKSGSKSTEFGAKVDMSECEGFVDFERVDYNNFNESQDLVSIVENFRQKNGYYPEAVLVDKIYLTKANRAYLKSKGIAHYGAPLGRPPKMSAAQKRERAKKQNKRSEIEGKFGQAKIKFGMNCIKTRLMDTNMAKIGLIAMALNIWKLLQGVLLSVFDSFLLFWGFRGSFFWCYKGGFWIFVPAINSMRRIA